MKQDDESCNPEGGQNGMMSGTAPKESKSSGDTNDAQSLGPANSERVSDGEDHALNSTGGDSTAGSTGPELNTSANTSVSSLGPNSRSPTSDMGIIDGILEYEMELSVSSCNDSVSECNPRDNVSSCSGCSIHSRVNEKSGRNCENNDSDHSHTPPQVVPNLDGRRAETADDSLSESNPRDNLSSTSASTPGVSDTSGRNSGTSDMENSPSETTPSSDGRQEDAVGVALNSQDTVLQNERSASMNKNIMTLRSGRVTQAESVSPKKHHDTSKMKKKFAGRPMKRRYSVGEQSHSSSEENPEKLLRLESSDAASSLQDTENSTSTVDNTSEDITHVSSALPSENTTMTIAEDSTVQNEQLLPENASLQDTANTTNFVDNTSGDITNVSWALQSANTTMVIAEDSAAENEQLLPEKASLQSTENSTSFVDNTSGDIMNVSSALPNADTTMAIAEDSPAENEQLLPENDDEEPCHEVSDKTPVEQEEVTMRNEKSEDETLRTGRVEFAPGNELKYVIKEEVLDQEPTNSESSAYHSADDPMGMVSLPRKVTGNSEGIRFTVKHKIPEEPAFSGPSTVDSDASTADINGTQPSGPESSTSRDSAKSSGEKKFPRKSTIFFLDPSEDDSCDDSEGSSEGSEEEVNNTLQGNSVETCFEIRSVEFITNSDSRLITVDYRKTTRPSATRGGSTSQPRVGSTSRRDSDGNFECNVTLNPEVDEMKEPMQEIHHFGPQELTAAPDSSTEETVGEITANTATKETVEEIITNTATKEQQQISPTTYNSTEAAATRDEQMGGASLHHDSLSECTKKVKNDIPLENRNTESSDTRDTEEETAENVPQGTGDLESPDDAHFDQRNLQIYRYVTTSGGSDVRYSPYVTRRRPLRSGSSGGETYRRVIFSRGQRHEAQQAEDQGVQTTSGGPVSFGDTCSIS